MPGLTNTRKAVLRAVAQEIIKHAREDEPLALPLTVDGQTIESRTMTEAIIAHWMEIAEAKNVHVHAAPVAVEAFEGSETLHVTVYLPYNYKLEIMIGDGMEPAAWITAPECGCECYCDEERR